MFHLIILFRLTSEYRDSLVKQTSKYSEQAKVGLRQARKNAMDAVKKAKLTQDDERQAEKKVTSLDDSRILLISTIDTNTCRRYDQDDHYASNK